MLMVKISKKIVFNIIEKRELDECWTLLKIFRYLSEFDFFIRI